MSHLQGKRVDLPRCQTRLTGLEWSDRPVLQKHLTSEVCEQMSHTYSQAKQSRAAEQAYMGQFPTLNTADGTSPVRANKRVPNKPPTLPFNGAVSLMQTFPKKGRRQNKYIASRACACA